MSALLESISEFEAREVCKVVVLYDGADMREKAMRFCNHLMFQFSEDLTFEFEWWRTDFLAEIQLAKISAAQAKDADVFIICINPGKQLAPLVQRWFDSWANEHAGHIGALVDLGALTMAQPGCAWATQQFLREVAKVASLDYLEPTKEAANPCGIFAQSATASPLGWDDSPAPEHYGLNE